MSAQPSRITQLRSIIHQNGLRLIVRCWKDKVRIVKALFDRAFGLAVWAGTQIIAEVYPCRQVLFREECLLILGKRN